MISKTSDLFQIWLSFSKLLEKVVMSQLLDHLNTDALWPRFQSAYRARHSTETALGVLNDLTVSDGGQVSLLTLLDLSSAFDTTDQAFSSIGSNTLLAYRNLLFRSFDPIWPKDSKRYPFLVTVQIPPLSVIVYPQVQFSVPYCFFCTNNHSHKSLTDTQFLIVNLPMIAKCTIQCHVNIFALWLAVCSHV